MERETIEIVTKGNHKVVLKSYATGREARAIEGKYFESAKMEIAGGAPSMKGMSLGGAFEAEKEMLRLLVVSIDGKTDNAHEVILDLPQNEYEEVIAKLNDITKKK